jgi:hypothetical protein
MFAKSFHSSVIRRRGTVLARYEVSSGVREVVGYSEDSGIAVFDRGPGEPGRGLPVDRGFFWEDGLEAFVREYVRHAEAVDSVPLIAAGFDPLTREPRDAGESAEGAQEESGRDEEGDPYEVLLRQGRSAELRAVSLSAAEERAEKVYGATRVVFVGLKTSSVSI